MPKRDDELSREQKQAILLERAEALAQAPVSLSKKEHQIDILEIIISGERFAVEAKYVREANKLPYITPLPCTPGFIRGLFNFRGQIIALLDLREILELDLQKIQKSDLQIVVLQTSTLKAGIAVDEIIGISSISELDMQAAQQLASQSVAPLLKGISKDNLTVIDIEKLFSDSRLIVDKLP